MGMRTLAPLLVLATFAFSAHGERIAGEGVEGNQQQPPQQSAFQQMQQKVQAMTQAASEKKGRGAASDASAEAGKEAQKTIKTATDKQEAEFKKAGESFLCPRDLSLPTKVSARAAFCASKSSWRKVG